MAVAMFSWKILFLSLKSATHTVNNAALICVHVQVLKKRKSTVYFHESIRQMEISDECMNHQQ